MPRRAKKECSKFECKELVDVGISYCDSCKKQARKDYKRKDYNKWYSSSRWMKSRRLFLLLNPLCCNCKNNDVVKAATVVDHIIAHKGDRVLFWDKSNWQALCASCHNSKTAKEDGGFGNEM